MVSFATRECRRSTRHPPKARRCPSQSRTTETRRHPNLAPHLLPLLLLPALLLLQPHLCPIHGTLRRPNLPLLPTKASNPLNFLEFAVSACGCRPTKISTPLARMCACAATRPCSASAPNWKRAAQTRHAASALCCPAPRILHTPPFTRFTWRYFVTCCIYPAARSSLRTAR